MGVSEFYSKMQDDLKLRQEHDENVTLEMLMYEGLWSKNRIISAKELHNSYLANDSNTRFVLSQLVPKLTDEWRYEGEDHSKIFSYFLPTREQYVLLLSISAIVFGEDALFSRDTKLNDYVNYTRFPTILKKLVEDNYLNEENISPSLQKSYPLEDECIASYKKHPFADLSRWYDSRIIDFKINSNIYERIAEKFKANDCGNYGVVKFNPDHSLLNMNLVELEEIVSNNLKYATRPEVPLSGFGAIFKISSQEFIDLHAFHLAFMLDLKYKSMSVADLIEAKGNKFIEGTIEYDKSDKFSRGKLFCGMTLNQDYATIAINAGNNVDSVHEVFGTKIFAAKLLVENYAHAHGISIYTENFISPSSKIIIKEKIETLNYVKENIDRISGSFDDQTILKIIDFSKHNYGFNAKVVKKYDCSCGEKVIEGTFNYNFDGLRRKENYTTLKFNKAQFSLSQLHMVAKHPSKYSPTIHELEVIEELVKITKNWSVYKLPSGLEKEYVEVMKRNLQADDASSDSDDWCEEWHSSPSYTEDEMIANPELRDEVEFDHEILSAPSVILKPVEPLIERIIEEIQKNQVLPNKTTECDKGFFINEELVQSYWFSSRLIFLTDMYDSFKAQTFLNPAPETILALNEIESVKKMIDDAHILEEQIRQRRLLNEEKQNQKFLDE